MTVVAPETAGSSPMYHNMRKADKLKLRGLFVGFVVGVAVENDVPSRLETGALFISTHMYAARGACQLAQSIGAFKSFREKYKTNT